MITITQSQMIELYIRTCKDSGYKLHSAEALKFVAKLVSMHPLEYWSKMGVDLIVLEQISKGTHPVCNRVTK